MRKKTTPSQSPVVTGKAKSLGTESAEPRLLYSRKQTAYLLGGVDGSFIRRLEKSGALPPVRLNRRSATSMVFFRASDVLRLIEEAAE